MSRHDTSKIEEEKIKFSSSLNGDTSGHDNVQVEKINSKENKENEMSDNGTNEMNEKSEQSEQSITSTSGDEYFKQEVKKLNDKTLQTEEWGDFFNSMFG